MIVLDEKEHETFRRVGHDLLMKLEISLAEALCGFQRGITTLDGRTLVITSLPGEVVKHDDMRSILNEGMPHYKSPFEKGRLIITFQVAFPTDNWIPSQKLLQLETLLPPRQEQIIPDGAEDAVLHRFDPSAERSAGGHRGEAFYSDEEDGPQGSRVQCAQQ